MCEVGGVTPLLPFRVVHLFILLPGAIKAGLLSKLDRISAESRSSRPQLYATMKEGSISAKYRYSTQCNNFF
jgi:hypothetical protein